MIDRATWDRLLTFLYNGTIKDTIIWENMMLNIHTTVLNGKKILTDWERDERPMISIDGSVLEARDAGIEGLRKLIHEQYKRLKKYQHSEEARAAQTAIEVAAKAYQLQNITTFENKVHELLTTVGIICEKCHELLSLRTQEIATALGLKAVLCEKCNPHNSKLTEADREKIREILLGLKK